MTVTALRPSGPRRARARGRRAGAPPRPRGSYREPDVRHGRRPGDGAGQRRLVRRQLDGDDGRDDAPGGRADGRGIRPPSGSRRRGRCVRRRLSGHVARRRARGLRGHRGRPLTGPGLPRLGLRRPLRRGWRHRLRRPVPAHRRQEGLPATLPRPPVVHARALAAGPTGRPAHGPRARRLLHRLQLGAHGDAVRARRDEPDLDGDDRGLGRGRAAARPARAAGRGAGARGARSVRRAGARGRPQLTVPGSQPMHEMQRD